MGELVVAVVVAGGFVVLGVWVACAPAILSTSLLMCSRAPAAPARADR
jgi:hypothetical protein